MEERLPALFISYYSIVLTKKLTGGRNARNERECRTLCEILDAVISGKLLRAAMVALGRLKAVESSPDPDGGGWALARQMELTARPEQGLVSGRDRALEARDQRDEQRAFHPRQWGART